MKIELKKKRIPRDEAGDPCFKELSTDWLDDPTPSVLRTFTEEEVVYMVNRYIYFTEAQQAAHGKRAIRQRAALHLVRKKVRAMFGVSYDNATREQQEAALRALTEGKEA